MYVEPHHFDAAHDALLYALEQVLGEENFDSTIRETWSLVYTAVSTCLKQGVKQKELEKRDSGGDCIVM